MILQFETNRITLNFFPELEIKQKQYIIKAYAKNPDINSDKKLIYTSDSFKIKPKKNAYFLDVDYWYYTRVAKYLNNSSDSLPIRIDFYFSICIGDEENEIPNPYRVHFIKYIPELLEIAGYKQAKKAHSMWFRLPAEDNADIAEPVINLIDFTVLLHNSSNFKYIYQKHLEKIITLISTANRNDVKKSLANQLQKFIDINTQEIAYSFGNTDYKFTDSNDLLVPVFDTFYFYEAQLQKQLVNGIDDEMDGLLFSDCYLRVIALGKIIKKKTHLGIRVERLGFYLKDQFGFSEYNDEVSLSYCEVIDKEKVVFSREPIINNESFKITSASYQNYRKDHELGGDFNWYSNIHFEEVSIDLIL